MLRCIKEAFPIQIEKQLLTVEIYECPNTGFISKTLRLE